MKPGTLGAATTTRAKCGVCGGEAYRDSKGRMMLHTARSGEDVCSGSTKGARP